MEKLAVLLLGVILVSCSSGSETVNNQQPSHPVAPKTDGQSEFQQGKFKIYTLYQPQVQRKNFNGVFFITDRSARIERAFWKERFNELTRPDYYGDFFLEFYDYMAYLASAYPAPTRQKELILSRLEKSFHAFCAILNIEERFKKFQQQQMRIYGE